MRWRWKFLWYIVAIHILGALALWISDPTIVSNWFRLWADDPFVILLGTLAYVSIQALFVAFVWFIDTIEECLEG